jgi:hypothetical protein
VSVPYGQGQNQRQRQRAGAPALQGDFSAVPAGLGSSFFSLPTACAVGCILSPLCGWGLVGPYAALKRRSSTVVSAFGPTERRALPGWPAE